MRAHFQSLFNIKSLVTFAALLLLLATSIQIFVMADYTGPLPTEDTAGTVGGSETTEEVSPETEAEIGEGDEGVEEEATDQEISVVYSCDPEEQKTVSGYIYYDENEDEERNDEEVGLSDIEVKVYYEEDGTKNYLVTVETNEDGFWQTELCSGEYKAEIDKDDLPEDYELEGDDTIKMSISEDAGDITGSNFLVKEAGEGFFSGLNWLLCPAVLGLFGLSGILVFLLSRARRRDN